VCRGERISEAVIGQSSKCCENMPYISFQVKNAKIVKAGFEHLRRAIPEISRLRLYQAAVEIVRGMKQPGKPIQYPVRWDTQKQRRAYFATKGTFIRGYTGPSKIPTKRTRIYQKAWQLRAVTQSPANVGYDVGNPLAHARHIGGRSTGGGQSKIHKGRWPLFKRQVEIVVKKLPKIVRDHLKQIARREGFRTRE